MAQSEVGLAIGSGTDVAIEVADVTLRSGDLRTAVPTMNDFHERPCAYWFCFGAFFQCGADRNSGPW